MKYQIIKMPDPNYRKSNAYFLECESDARPFIIIRQRSKWCELSWAFISMHNQGFVFKPDDGLNLRIKDIMDKHWKLKRKYWFFGPVASVPRLTLEEAKAAAEEVYKELIGCRVCQSE